MSNTQILLNEALCFDDVLLEPQFSAIPHRADVDVSSSLGDGRNQVRLSTPVIPANMDTVTSESMFYAATEAGSFGYVHRGLSPDERLSLAQRELKPGITVGISDEERELALRLIDEGVVHICVDVAHGDHFMMYDTVDYIKNHASADIVLCAGNVCTQGATDALANSGADIVKVGIGPGSVCSTRIVTGHGYPQLSAIAQCSQVKGVQIIADGGCRNTGDITKALAAGADAVMSGFLFAGCSECPGQAVMNYKTGRLGYVYRGMASFKAQAARGKKPRLPEGVSAMVEKKGPVANVISKMKEGIQSGLSYSGANNLIALRECAQWVKITSNTVRESGTRL